LEHIILRLVASKHMRNFSPHLICVATLPDNILATKQTRFSLGGRLNKIMDDQLMTDKFQQSLKFQVLTDVSVVDLPDSARGH